MVGVAQMSDNESALARSWLDEARQVTLSNAPDASTVAIENMLVLGIPHPVDVRDIHAALEGVRAEYRKKVEQCGKAGLFYSWVDDASGTIRCGFGEISYHPQSGWFDEGPQRGPPSDEGRYAPGLPPEAD